MGKNPVVAVIAVIILIVAVVLIIKGMGGEQGGPSGSATWYDTGTGQLYGTKPGQTPPMPAPSGKEGVAASVFSDGSCDNKAERFIGFLFKYTDEGKTQLAAARAKTPVDEMEVQRIATEEKLIKREKDEEWVVQGTEEGAAIMAEVRARRARGCPTHLE